MAELTRLVLVRHGESNATVEKRIAGMRTCTGLSAHGVRQAELLRDRLARSGELNVDVLVSSTMPRAMQTADIIAPALGGLTPVIEADVREQDPGDCDGITFDEYVERFGMPDWHGAPDLVVFPGGETITQFHARVADCVRRVLATHAGATVLVACHGGVIDAVLRHLLGLPIVGGFELNTVNTSITELLDAGARWRLMRYNDAAHLQ